MSLEQDGTLADWVISDQVLAFLRDYGAAGMSKLSPDSREELRLPAVMIPSSPSSSVPRVPRTRA